MFGEFTGCLLSSCTLEGYNASVFIVSDFQKGCEKGYKPDKILWFGRVSSGLTFCRFSGDLKKKKKKLKQKETQHS